MMRKEKRKSTTVCLAAVVILTCHMVQTIDCLRLKKTEKHKPQSEADSDAVATPAVVREGQIVFGDVLRKESQVTDGTGKASTNATEDETAYQADSTGWSSVNKDDGSSQEKWNHLGSSLHCLEDHMKFRYLGPEASHLTVKQEDKSHLPVSMVPQKCGYNMHGNSLVFVMTVPYHGCNVVEKGGSYVLPLQWHGNPVSLLCPNHATEAVPHKHHWPHKLLGHHHGHHWPHKPLGHHHGHHWHHKPLGHHHHGHHWHHKPLGHHHGHHKPLGHHHGHHWHHKPQEHHGHHWHHKPQDHHGHHWHHKPQDHHGHHWHHKPQDHHGHHWHHKPQDHHGHHWHHKPQEHHGPHEHHWHHKPLAHLWQHWQHVLHKPKEHHHWFHDAQVQGALQATQDAQVQVVPRVTQDAQDQVVPQATQDAQVQVSLPAPQDPQIQILPPVHHLPPANYYSHPLFSHSFSATNLPEFPNYPPYAQLSFPPVPPPPATTAEPTTTSEQKGVSFPQMPFQSYFPWSFGPNYPHMPVHPYDPKLQYPWSQVPETKPTASPSPVTQASDAVLPFYSPEHLPFLPYEHMYFPRLPHKG